MRQHTGSGSEMTCKCELPVFICTRDAHHPVMNFFHAQLRITRENASMPVGWWWRWSTCAVVGGGSPTMTGVVDSKSSSSPAASDKLSPRNSSCKSQHHMKSSTKPQWDRQVSSIVLASLISKSNQSQLHGRIGVLKPVNRYGFHTGTYLC